MSGERHLSAVPGRHEQQVLDWLGAPEPADASSALDVAFDRLPAIRQLRAWPWTSLAQRIRPEPLGNPQVRAVALAFAAALLLAIVAGTLLFVGTRPNRDGLPALIPPIGNVTPAPASPFAGPFPLASPGYEVVVANGNDASFTIRTADGARRPIATELTGRLISPSWGPGTTALLQEETQSQEQMWVVDTTGAQRSLVIVPCVVPCQSRNEPTWSHDGSRIVFFQALGTPTNGIPQTCGLALYTVATLEVSSVTASPCAVIEERHPRFSPDDTKLAFWRSRSPGLKPIIAIADSAIFTRDLATGRETQVTDWSLHASDLDWSPDGRWIAFVPDYWDSTADGADMWRIHPDGTGLERMTTLDTVSIVLARPRYTPDGSWLLFMQVHPGEGATGTLWAMPADGGDPVEVLPGTNVLDFDVRADTGG